MARNEFLLVLKYNLLISYRKKLDVWLGLGEIQRGLKYSLFRPCIQTSVVSIMRWNAPRPYWWKWRLTRVHHNANIHFKMWNISSGVAASLEIGQARTDVLYKWSHMAVPLLTPKHIAALVAYSIFKMAVNMADFMQKTYTRITRAIEAIFQI